MLSFTKYSIVVKQPRLELEPWPNLSTGRSNLGSDSAKISRLKKKVFFLHQKFFFLFEIIRKEILSIVC